MLTLVYLRFSDYILIDLPFFSTGFKMIETPSHDTTKFKKYIFLNSRFALPYLFLTSFLFLTACGVPDTPQIVSEKFWQSISTQNFHRAEKFSLNSFLDPGLKNLDVNDFKIDNIRIKNNNAKINTSIWLNESGQTKEIQLITHMVQLDEQWLVDTVKTADSRMPGALHELFKSLEEVKDSFMESIRKSADDMEEQIPEIEDDLQNLGKELINNLDEVLDEILPKIESAVEKNLDEMNNALDELEDEFEELENKQPSNPDPSNNGNKTI